MLEDVESLFYFNIIIPFSNFKTVAVVLVNSSIWWLILIHRHSKSYPKYKSSHTMTSYFYDFINCAFSQKTTQKQNRYLIPVLLLIWEKLIHLHNYSSNGSSFLSECTAQSLSVTMAFPNGSNIDVSYGQKRLNLTLTLSRTRTGTRELHIVMVFLLLCHVLWSRRNIFSSSFVSRRPSSQHSLLSYSCHSVLLLYTIHPSFLWPFSTPISIEIHT